MDYLSQVIFVQLAIFVWIKFFELFPQKLFVFLDGAVKATGDELGIVDLTTIVKVHSIEDLIDILISKFAINLFSEIVKAYHHLVSRNHSISIFIQFQKYFSEMVHFVLRDLHCQVHQDCSL